MSDNDFSTYFIKNIDECIRYYENIILLGDLNFDMVNNQKCQFSDSRFPFLLDGKSVFTSTIIPPP
jgi:hypothetical protein